MKTIFQNGMIKDIPFFLNGRNGFAIQELDDLNAPDRIVYSGDSIKYDLDGELVGLYDYFTELLFEDSDQYYKEVYSLPIWIQEAGQSSDTIISSNEFSQLINETTIPNLFKHLYLVDCQFLIGSVQNLLCAMETAFVDYYKSISSFPIQEYVRDFSDNNGLVMTRSSYSIQASASVETYFTKAYSILDIMSKICYEIQHLRTEFTAYEKLESANKLWGVRKQLKISGCEGTIFEDCELISNIQAIRNEIVHNGTWELNPKIFIRFNNGEEVERFMLYPDMVQGRLSAVKNRRHFFSDNVKVNDIFPAIHLEFKQRLLVTVNEIRRIYS